MNRAHCGRERIHSTTAMVGTVRKCEKYTIETTTSHHWTTPRCHRCSCSHSVGVTPSVNQPNISLSAAISSVTCGANRLSAYPREML
jgi:hypothetical protein